MKFVNLMGCTHRYMHPHSCISACVLHLRYLSHCFATFAKVLNETQMNLPKVPPAPSPSNYGRFCTPVRKMIKAAVAKPAYLPASVGPSLGKARNGMRKLFNLTTSEMEDNRGPAMSVPSSNNRKYARIGHTRSHATSAPISALN